MNTIPTFKQFVEQLELQFLVPIKNGETKTKQLVLDLYILLRDTIRF